MARQRKPKVVSREARQAAREAVEVVERVRLSQRTPSDLVECTIGGAEVVIPARALDQLVDILAALGDGIEAAVVPGDIAIGTEEVARVLGVSRRWAAEIIDRADLVGTKVGSKRRVVLRDLAEYERERRT